jgi:hypothetical protein
MCWRSLRTRSTSPLAIEAAHSSFTGIDFAPRSLSAGQCRRVRLSIASKAISGFRRPMPAHRPRRSDEVQLLNFAGCSGQPLALNLQRFAYNKTFEEAFPDGIRGFNRPTNVRFGLDGCAYVADYGAVRDLGRSDPDTAFKNGAAAALVQIRAPG